MARSSEICLTETGRLLDTSNVDVLEFVSGRWVPARSPLLCDEMFNARVLSNAELENILRSGKFN